jgi:hypothetical protein
MNQSTQRIIRNKIGLLNLAEELGNVSKACRAQEPYLAPSLSGLVQVDIAVDRDY